MQPLLISVLLTAFAVLAHAGPVRLEHTAFPDSVVPAQQTVFTFRVDGLVDAAAPSLGAFDLTLFYDSSVLTFDDALFGDPVNGNQLDLAGFGSLQFVVPNTAEVRLLEISFDSPTDLNDLQLGSFQLAQLRFTAIAAGNPDVSLGPVELSDAFGNPIRFEFAEVPEPGSVCLFVTGAAVLALASSRRTKKL
jgi:hypothetical protein